MTTDDKEKIAHLETRVAQLTDVLEAITNNPGLKKALDDEAALKRKNAEPSAPPPDEFGRVEVRVVHGKILVPRADIDPLLEKSARDGDLEAKKELDALLAKMELDERTGGRKDGERFVGVGETHWFAVKEASRLVKKGIAKFVQEPA